MKHSYLLRSKQYQNYKIFKRRRCMKSITLFQRSFNHIICTNFLFLLNDYYVAVKVFPGMCVGLLETGGQRGIVPHILAEKSTLFPSRIDYAPDTTTRPSPNFRIFLRPCDLSKCKLQVIPMNLTVACLQCNEHIIRLYAYVCPLK